MSTKMEENGIVFTENIYAGEETQYIEMLLFTLQIITLNTIKRIKRPLLHYMFTFYRIQTAAAFYIFYLFSNIYEV